MPMDRIMSSLSNNHIIPANKEILKTLHAIRVGDIIDLRGYLAGVEQNGEWIWFSSLSRTDTGDGACEIVYAEELRIHPRP